MKALFDISVAKKLVFPVLEVYIFIARYPVFPVRLFSNTNN